MRIPWIESVTILRTPLTFLSQAVLPRDLVLLAFMLLGMANALVGPACGAVQDQGWAPGLANGLGSGWAVYFAILIAVLLGLRQPEAVGLRALDWLVLPVMSIGLLLPSSALASLLVAALAARELWLQPGGTAFRACCLLFLTLAARELWVSTGMKILSPGLLPIDTFLMSHTLALLGFHPVVSGNLITMDDQRTLAVMMGCSSFTNISLALLVWLAITRWVRPGFRRIDWVTGPLVALAVVLTNLVRLTVMGLSADAYTIAHGEIGRNATEGAILVLTLAITRWGLLAKRASA